MSREKGERKGWKDEGRREGEKKRRERERDPAPLGPAGMEMPGSLQFDGLPLISVLPLHFHKYCVPQIRLKQHSSELPTILFLVSRNLHLILVLVKTCSTTAALAEPAKETLPEVTQLLT